MLLNFLTEDYMGVIDEGEAISCFILPNPQSVTRYHPQGNER